MCELRGRADARERVADPVGHRARELADGREPLGPQQRLLRLAEGLECAGVLERQRGLAGDAAHELALGLRERGARSLGAAGDGAEPLAAKGHGLDAAGGLRSRRIAEQQIRPLE